MPSPLPAQPPDPAAESENPTGDAAQPWNQADRFFDPGEMARSRDRMRAEHGSQPSWFIMLDRLEYRFGEEDDSFETEAQAWYGGDLNRVRLEIEGERSISEGKTESLQTSVMYSRAVSTFWDFQAGLRRDSEPHGVNQVRVGMYGLAPYLFEMDFSALIDQDGKASAELEAEYEIFLTQRLILQPSAEAVVAFDDIPGRELARGLAELDFGLRLRYEFTREFAPYVGIEWERYMGSTGDLLEAHGEEREHFAIVAGFRIWF